MSYYLCNAAGFFLQFAPCMVLYILPFSIEAFRVSRKWIWVGCGIISITSSMMFPWYLELPLATNLPLGDRADLYMSFFVIVYIIFFFSMIETQVIKKLLVLILVMFYATTQFLSVNIFTSMIPVDTTYNAYPPTSMLCFLIATIILFPIAFIMMKKTVREYLREIEIRNIQREFKVVLSMALLYIFLLFVYSSESWFDFFNYWTRITSAMLFTSVGLFLFLWTLFKESVRRKKEGEIQRVSKLQQMQYDKITNEMEQARRMRHDMRHYLNGLSDMVNQNRIEELNTYLQEVLNVTTSRENEIYCTNLTVNGLLQYYVGLARNEHIQCTVMAKCDEKVNVATADLTVLFGNTMENAIHACRKCPKDPWIDVQIGMINASFIVQISNSCSEIFLSGRYRLNGDFLPAEAFVSSRLGGGYGLGSLSHTAQKYGGEARFKYDDIANTFTTRIRLNLHSEML